MISQCPALHLHHPIKQLLIIWEIIPLCYPFHLGKKIICALIDYVSNLIIESHFEDLFSETNFGFIILNQPGSQKQTDFTFNRDN